jgi:hypothetical protein
MKLRICRKANSAEPDAADKPIVAIGLLDLSFFIEIYLKNLTDNADWFTP